MSSRTDLCDTCQHFRDGLHYNARQEEEAKDLLKRFKEHLSKQQANKELLNKIADLEKQLANKDQEREQSIEELKLKI
ncbi:11972_t:CDS:2 [Funneliformis geosporum]|nr:11972_t:CDS:2 [Funneliformis geosporum]